MGMFGGLGSRVRLNELERRHLDFEDAVAWATEHLRKDDRIVWFLGIIQRAALLRLRDGERSLSKKVRRKIDRKLKGFGDDRVNEDFESDFAVTWPHYQSLADIYKLARMRDYSFHVQERNRLIPKPAALILSDHEEMEERLMELAGGERFCSDGEPFLKFKNGWTWFLIEEGGSYQEAQAMRHCGNGVGKPDDLLLSLREPLVKGDVVFWKPHLTFILNDGALGEMKGYANAKPDSRYHVYVEGLLYQSEVRQVRGGGYLPENNFSFADMAPARQRRTLETNPKLEVDPFGDDGEILIEGQGQRWIQSSQPKFAPRVEEYFHSSPSWIAFQPPIHSSSKTAWVSQAWCGLHEGTLGALSLTREDVPRMLEPTAADLLLQPHLKQFSVGQDPLAAFSNWGKALNLDGCRRVMEGKPAFFRCSPLKAVWSLAGLSDAYVAVLNDRFGLDFRKVVDGIEIRRFDSPRGFARETGNGRLIRLLRQRNEGILRVWRDESPFEVPWLRLRFPESQEQDQATALVLAPEGAELFFEVMDFQNLSDYKGFIYEIAYRFGLRKVRSI